MSMEKKFNYSRDDIRQMNLGITDMFALEALSEDEEDDLDDYDPENDVDRVDDEDDEDDSYDADSEIDGDSDPAEEEDDEYDDVVEHIGIDNMEEILSIEELDAEDLMKLKATEDAVDIAFNKSTNEENVHDLFKDNADSVFGIDFSDDDVVEDDAFDSDFFND